MRKSYILYIVIIVSILSSLCIIDNNTSALSYESSVGIGFTFNPTLSVSLSSSDLVISNLTPGSSNDSNSINVSVATNAAYGYTLSANASSNDLVHSNNTNTFSSIATDADLASLDEDENNIWGYSTSLDNGSSWSNYNGLSSSSSATLLDTNTNNSGNNSNNNNNLESNGVDTIDFKIAAKAGSTQPSGIYTNTINFIAVTKVAPMSLLDSFIASGAEQLNGYFKMQDMTHSICENVDIEESELQLIDVRDNKTYWVAKLKDGNCWMTQNLDLDLSHEVALTSETSDIDTESYGKTIYTQETGYTKDEATGVVSWLPSTIDDNGIQRADTIDMAWNGDNATLQGWATDYYAPYSANPGNRYKYTNTSYVENDYSSLEDCVNDNNSLSGCQHSHYGNYYNWSAAIASNNSHDAPPLGQNSICSKNWKLPKYTEYGPMLKAQNVWSGSGYTYSNNGFNIIRTSPLYFGQFGIIYHSAYYPRNRGSYWSTNRVDVYYADFIYFNNEYIKPGIGDSRFIGMSLRCLAQ